MIVNNADEITMYVHVTSGGAIYLTDNHSFSEANIIIRLDGGAELLRCDIEVKEQIQ